MDENGYGDNTMNEDEKNRMKMGMGMGKMTTEQNDQRREVTMIETHASEGYYRKDINDWK